MAQAKVIRMEGRRVSPGRGPVAVPRCRALRADGSRCRRSADQSGLCPTHREELAAAVVSPEEVPGWQRHLREATTFLRRRLIGDYQVDEFGFDPELAVNLLAPLLRPFYRSYWRIASVGLAEHVPSEGRALLVCNHAGTLPFDAAMVRLGVFDDHPAHRHLRMLTADLAFGLPFIGPLARKSGATLACPEDATRLLEAGELVAVWPEGFKGIGKPFSERYRLQRFGRGGFVHVAVETGSPIIPVAVVGSEEIYPLVFNWKTAARLLGFPYFPITPTFPLLGPFGVIPLPSKWVIEYGEPIETAGLGAEAASDPMLLFDLTDRVRDAIQQTLYKNLVARRHVFF